MIVLSFVLVVVAAVTLIIGLFQTTLDWIWVSIGSCVVAMIFLGIGVLQRRRVPVPAEEPGYRAGVATGPGGPVTTGPAAPPAREPAVPAPATTSWSPVGSAPTRTAPPIATRRPTSATTGTRAEPPAAAREEPTAEAVEQRVEVGRHEPEPAAAGTAATTRKAAARKAAAVRKTAKKATKKATKKAVKRAPARTTAKKTTGEAARRELAKVRGVGPAKQEALLREFGSLEAIRAASVEELVRIRGIGAGTARQLRGEG